MTQEPLYERFLSSRLCRRSSIQSRRCICRGCQAQPGDRSILGAFGITAVN